MKNSGLTAAFLAPHSTVDYVYGAERTEAISRRIHLVQPDPVIEPESLLSNLVETSGVNVLFSTWGMPSLTVEQIDEHLPHLQAVFYAAGTVGNFAGPLLERGVTIVSAWRANAVSVAQFTVAQAILAMKGYFRNLREYDLSKASYTAAHRGKGAYGETVALLGAGAIGRMVVELLRPYDVHVIVWDPFLDESSALALGVEKVESIAEAFTRGYVVSNHLADKPETEKMISADALRLMRPDATFINTGRGRTVDEPALVSLLTDRPDLTALLDVTHPEPPGIDSPLTELPNAYITSHIAGTIGDEVHRMADLCIREFDRFIAGQPLHHSVTREMLKLLA